MQTDTVWNYCGRSSTIDNNFVFSILQVPAAYVPLDPEVPALLSAHIIDQCGLKYCVVQWDLLEVNSQNGEHHFST